MIHILRILESLGRCSKTVDDQHTYTYYIGTATAVCFALGCVQVALARGMDGGVDNSIYVVAGTYTMCVGFERAEIR